MIAHGQPLNWFERLLHRWRCQGQPLFRGPSPYLIRDDQQNPLFTVEVCSRCRRVVRVRAPYFSPRRQAPMDYKGPPPALTLKALREHYKPRKDTPPPRTTLAAKLKRRRFWEGR